MRLFLSATLLLAASACSGGMSSGGATVPAAAPAVTAAPFGVSAPVPAASAAAVLGTQLEIGAWANPPGSVGTSSQKLAVLETQLGRHLDISVHYDPFAATFPSADEINDRSNGRVPQVSWGCGGTDADVAAGRYDAIIAAKAQAMAAYGAPILLRYKWEFNLTATANNRLACADPAHDTNGFFSPTEFVAAWQHIHTLFVAAGASNVKFVWNPSGQSRYSALPYWPGDANVDWIGIDAYDRSGIGLARTIAPAYASYGEPGSQWHPVIIAETGAMANTATYLDAATRATLASQFPSVRAVTYFDAVGPAGNWSFTPPGLASFKIFADQ